MGLRANEIEKLVSKWNAGRSPSGCAALGLGQAAAKATPRPRGWMAKFDLHLHHLNIALNGRLTGAAQAANARTQCEPSFTPEDAPLNPHDVWENPPSVLQSEFESQQTCLGKNLANELDLS